MHEHETDPLFTFLTFVRFHPKLWRHDKVVQQRICRATSRHSFITSLVVQQLLSDTFTEPWWSWSYGNWIYTYLCKISLWFNIIKYFLKVLRLQWNRSSRGRDGIWKYTYLCHQYLSSLMLWVRILYRGEVYALQHYEITFVSDLGQVSDFLLVLRFPPPIKLTATIYL